MIKWFAANKLALNPDKTNIMQFITKDTTHTTLCIGYTEKYIEEKVNTKFLSLQTDNHLNWKNHTEKTSPKLSGEHDAVRLMVHVSNIHTLNKNLLCIFSFYYKIWNNFWGNSSHSGKISLPPPPPPPKKPSELWLVHNPDVQVKVYLNSLRFYLFHANIYFT
jgi:hypothetical protein